MCIKAATKLISRNLKKNILAPSVTPQNRLDNNRCEKWPYNCYQPYPAYLTYKFKCDYDGQCPNGFKCCQQECFTHKICSKSYKMVEELRRDDNKLKKLNSIKYGNAETIHTPLYRNGMNDNRENKYLPSNYPAENKTDLIRTTREVESVTEQNESITEEEEKEETEEEENSAEEEEKSTEEDTSTIDPNSINSDYSVYYENEEEEEEE